MTEEIVLRPEAEMFDDGLETNIIGIAQLVFSNPVRAPYSIGLQFDHPIDSDKTPEEVINEMLTLFLLAGAQAKYGETFTFRDLDQNRRDTLRQYMWSVGYDPFIHTDEVTESFWFEFKPYKCV